MPELSTRERDKLDRDQFAYVDREGGEHLPIDEAHIRNAISRFSQTDFQSQTAKEEAARKIVKAAKRHDIEVDEDSDVVKATR
jgi:preprotein translocase subunit SecA